MDKEKCPHEKLTFGSGGFYIFCVNCSRRWVACSVDNDCQPDYEASGDDLNGGDYRIKIVNKNGDG